MNWAQVRALPNLITGDEKKFSSQPYKIASVGMFDISKGEVWNLGIRNIFLEDFQCTMRQFNTSKLASFSRFSKWEKEMATGLRISTLLLQYTFTRTGEIFFFQNPIFSRTFLQYQPDTTVSPYFFSFFWLLLRGFSALKTVKIHSGLCKLQR